MDLRAVLRVTSCPAGLSSNAAREIAVRDETHLIGELAKRPRTRDPSLLLRRDDVGYLLTAVKGGSALLVFNPMTRTGRSVSANKNPRFQAEADADYFAFDVGGIPTLVLRDRCIPVDAMTRLARTSSVTEHFLVESPGQRIKLVPGAGP